MIKDGEDALITKDELEIFSLNFSRHPYLDVIAFNPPIRTCKLGQPIDFLQVKETYARADLCCNRISILINNDLDKHIQAKTSDKRVRRFGDILAPL